MQPGRPLLATTVRPEGAAPLDMASGTGENASNPMSEARLQVAGLPLPRGVLGEGAHQSVSAQQRVQPRDPPPGDAWILPVSADGYVDSKSSSLRIPYTGIVKYPEYVKSLRTLTQH